MCSKRASCPKETQREREREREREKERARSISLPVFAAAPHKPHILNSLRSCFTEKYKAMNVERVQNQCFWLQNPGFYRPKVFIVFCSVIWSLRLT